MRKLFKSVAPNRAAATQPAAAPPPLPPPLPPRDDPGAARFENALYHWQDATGQPHGPSDWADYKAAFARGDTHAGCKVFAAGVAETWAVVRDVPGLAQRVTPRSMPERTHTAASAPTASSSRAVESTEEQWAAVG